MGNTNSPMLGGDAGSSSPLLNIPAIFGSPAKGPANLGPRAAMMLKAAPVRYGKDTKFVDVPPEPAPCPTPRAATVIDEQPIEQQSATSVQPTQTVASPKPVWPATTPQPMAGVLEVRGVAAALQDMQRPRERCGGRFDSVSIPSANVEEYLTRLILATRAPSNVVGVTAVILYRYAERSNEAIHAYNAHRLVLTAFVLAHKSCDDWFFANSYYARIGGVSLQELNEMEVAMLMGLDFDLHAEIEEVDRILTAARAYVPPPSPVLTKPSAVVKEPQTAESPIIAAPRRRLPQAPPCFEMPFGMVDPMSMPNPVKVY